MAARLKKLEDSEDAVQKRREDADAVDTFTREHTQGLPTEMLRRVLPQTTDKKTLFAEMQKLEGWLKSYVSELVKRGLVYHRNIGGVSNEGGTVGPMAFGNDISPTDLIRAGLSRQRGQTRLGE